MRYFLALLLALPMQANDKVDHFLGGVAIGATVSIAFRWTGGTTKQSCKVGFVVGSAAGLQKEWLDGYVNKTIPGAHSVEVEDALATIAGAAVGSWLTYELMK